MEINDLQFSKDKKYGSTGKSLKRNKKHIHPDNFCWMFFRLVIF